MWFNLLPAYFIVTASIAVPGYLLYFAHRIFLGNHFRRSMNLRWDRYSYQRDNRITGNTYNVAGLESLPDEKK